MYKLFFGQSDQGLGGGDGGHLIIICPNLYSSPHLSAAFSVFYLLQEGQRKPFKAPGRFEGASLCIGWRFETQLKGQGLRILWTSEQAQSIGLPSMALGETVLGGVGCTGWNSNGSRPYKGGRKQVSLSHGGERGVG